MTIFPILLKASFNDKLSIIWALLLPVIILFIGAIFIENAGTAKNFLIAILAFSAISYGLMGTAFEYFNYRHSGIFKSIALSKIGVVLFLFNFALARIFVTIIGLILLTIFAIFILPLGFEMINLPIFIFYIFSVTILSNLLGVIAGNFGKDPGFIATTTNILMLVLIAGSGIFYPLQILPNWLAKIFEYFPLEIITQIAKSNEIVIFDVFYIIILNLILLTATIKAFRWE